MKAIAGRGAGRYGISTTAVALSDGRYIIDRAVGKATAELPNRIASALLRSATLLILCSGLFAAPRSVHAQAGPAAPPPAAVIVAPVERKAMTPTLTFTGRAEAIDKVDLRARVDGYLEQQRFTEGTTVKKGDLLFQIEQEQYRAKVEAARANVARSEANAGNTAVQLRRGQELLRSNNIAASVVDDRAANDAMARAELLQQKAALHEAEINLAYTQVYAPLDGQIGRSNYSVGNYVGPASGTLAMLVSREPIYVTFPVSQRELLALQKKAQESGLDRSAIKVRLQLADSSFYRETGSVDFLDVQVSAQTDTVIARAQMPNPDQLLIDGQLGTVVLELGTSQMALFIPQQALQFDQAGYHVLVVDGENRVKVRRVALGAGREGEVEIVSGLEEGERVITEGVQKVRPNDVVKVAEATGQAPRQ